MKWLTQGEFWSQWKDRCDASIDYVGWCYFEISEVDLRARIKNIEPNSDLRGEDDPPGPVLRWYGCLNDIPVLVDLHLQHPNGEAVTIYHGSRPGARNAVRAFFSDWGEDWQESSP